MAEFRRANAEVDQAEGGIAVVGIEFCQQPGCMCVQSEQLDDVQRVALLTARGGSAVVQQLGAVIVVDEWSHGRCAQVLTINGALFCANMLMRQSVTTVQVRFRAKGPERIPPNPWKYESTNAWVRNL